ncbi:PAS domain-containing sensor histidine kinase, partial [Acidithiobacillus ferrooxidans]|nr:PAS domain-containing sensor histidine kinase [Acidithiobacillus ferrooxidans]
MARRKNITTLPAENMVLDALESAVLILGAGYHIRYMNPAAENLLRIS